MKIVILSAVFALSAVLYGHAQQKGDISINGGVDVGMPMGDFGDAFDIGFGATVKGLYNLNESGQLGITLGYMGFGAKDNGSGVDASLGIIPIFALYRHHIGKLYLEPQLGFSLNKAKVKASGIGSMSASDNSFGYAVGVGYMINSIDLSLRYQGLSQAGEGSGFIGLRVGYNFNIGG
ncbi:outer membrane beta-barrel protein [Sinomicrobium sp.]